MWTCHVDLSALGIPFNSPANPSNSQEKPTQPVTNDILSGFYSPEIENENENEEEEDEEEVPQGFIKPGVVRRSRQLRLEKGIGIRRVPSFRKRVVLLPPLPISRQQDQRKDSTKEKQVRFFTNVICHEYQSY